MIKLSSLAGILSCRGSFLGVQSLWRMPLNLGCQSHVLAWIAGSSNQQILTERISLSPTVWPWCLCSGIQGSVGNLAQDAGFLIKVVLKHALKNRKITDNPTESGGLRAIFSWPHGTRHTNCCGHCPCQSCITLVLYHIDYSIFWKSYQPQKS